MAKTIVALLLIVVGLGGLLYGGFTFTREKKVVDLGSVEVTRQEHQRLPLSPVVGGLILVSGVWLLASRPSCLRIPGCGLMPACEYGRRVSSSRASEFWRCERSSIDPTFPKYPRLPVVVCRGYEPRATPEA